VCKITEGLGGDAALPCCEGVNGARVPWQAQTLSPLTLLPHPKLRSQKSRSISLQPHYISDRSANSSISRAQGICPSVAAPQHFDTPLHVRESTKLQLPVSVLQTLDYPSEEFDSKQKRPDVRLLTQQSQCQKGPTYCSGGVGACGPGPTFFSQTSGRDTQQCLRASSEISGFYYA
jgi:hypothetical protein